MAAKYLNNDLHLESPENKRTPIYKCDICDKEIFEGNDCYKIADIIYCSKCMDAHLQIIAETIDTEAFLVKLENEEVGN